MIFRSRKERRLLPRISTEVQCWLERDSITLFGSVTNLSPKGLFLRTPVTLPAGCDVNLNIVLKDGIVAALGRVVWEKAPSAHSSQIGLGISFDKITNGRSLLDQFITHQNKRPTTLF